MPYFDPKEARKFLGDAPVSAEEVDLRGLSMQEAACRLDTAIAPIPPGHDARLRIRIDPPVAGGGVTLFPALAGYLLNARRDRRILHFLPILPDGGAGFFVERLTRL